MSLDSVTRVMNNMFSFIENNLGKEEKITFVSNILHHCGDDNCDDDITIIGGKGKPITLDDIKKIVHNFTKQCIKEDDNGRSYFYEGMSKTKNNKYYINWGS